MFSHLKRFDPAKPVFLYSAEGTPTGGDDKAPPLTDEQRAEQIAAAVQQKFDAQSAKHNGDLTAALLDQIRKTHSAENGSRTFQSKVTELQQQVPDEATRTKWAGYEALGSIEELTAKVQRAQRADELEREKVTHRAAKLLKVDPENPLFKTLLGSVEFEVTGEGESEKATVKTDKGAIPFEEFVKTRPDVEKALPLLADAVQSNGFKHLENQPSGGQKVTTTDPAKAASDAMALYSS